MSIPAKDKAPYVQEMFTAIANRYDLLNSLLSFRLDGTWRRFTASKAVLPKGGLALDVGTGTGELARHLARQNSEGTILGLDFCPEMLKRAEDKLTNSPGKK